MRAKACKNDQLLSPNKIELLNVSSKVNKEIEKMIAKEDLSLEELDMLMRMEKRKEEAVKSEDERLEKIVKKLKEEEND